MPPTYHLLMLLVTDLLMLLVVAYVLLLLVCPARGVHRAGAPPRPCGRLAPRCSMYQFVAQAGCS